MSATPAVARDGVSVEYGPGPHGHRIIHSISLQRHDQVAGSLLFHTDKRRWTASAPRDTARGHGFHLLFASRYRLYSHVADVSEDDPAGAPDALARTPCAKPLRMAPHIESRYYSLSKILFKRNSSKREITTP